MDIIETLPSPDPDKQCLSDNLSFYITFGKFSQSLRKLAADQSLKLYIDDTSDICVSEQELMIFFK